MFSIPKYRIYLVIFTKVDPLVWGKLHLRQCHENHWHGIDLLAVTPTITIHTMTDYERIFVESMLGLVGNNVDLYARWQLMTDVQKMRVAYYQENCIKLDTAMNARKENTRTILFPMYCDSPWGED